MNTTFLPSRENFGKSGSLPGSGPGFVELRPVCAVSGVNFRRSAIRSQSKALSDTLVGEQAGFAYAECVRGDRATGFISPVNLQALQVPNVWAGHVAAPKESAQNPLAEMSTAWRNSSGGGGPFSAFESSRPAKEKRDNRATPSDYLRKSGVTFTHCR